MAIEHKTAPGIVKMKCMIWEPQPVVARPKQEDVFTYNENALRLMKGWNTPNLTGHENYISLAEKYIYYDTFLLYPSGDNLLTPGIGPYLSDIYSKDFNAQPLFDFSGTSVTPRSSWIWHQSFYPVTEGLFASTDVTSPFWTYSWLFTGYNTYDGQVEFDTSKTIDPGYTSSRKNWRIQPGQVVTTKTQSDPSSSSSSSGSTTNSAINLTFQAQKPVHWMVRKVTSLYEGEDFFVQFTKLSKTPDDVGTLPNGSVPIRDSYAFLDSESLKKDTSNGFTVPVNLGVVQLDADGTSVKEDTHKLNLRKQPYYAIELNVGDDVENYWLIIPWNGFPSFIQVGKDPVVYPGTNNTPPIVYSPSATAKISRLLSVYDISGENLMQQDNLRITIQNHFGKIKIVFSGYENSPWVIEGSRYDYQKWLTNANQQENDIPRAKCWMHIKNLPISIAAGNIPCGFSFAPLHRPKDGFVEHPQSITVRGPVEEADINLLMATKQSAKTPPPQPPKAKLNSYNQDADFFVERVNGKEVVSLKSDSVANIILQDDYLPETKRLRGGYGNDSPRQFKTAKATDVVTPSIPPNVASPCSIKTAKISPLTTPILNPGDIALANAQNTKDFLPKNFSYRHELRAGSVVVEPNNPKRKWVIPWCLTPLATGWTLNVPSSNAQKPVGGSAAGATVQNICPLDVAQHVTQFSLSTSFSDNAKVEKSGSIRFIINPGQMTGLDYASTATDAGTGTGLCDDPDNQNVDRSIMLSNLCGKTFTVRIYAWWDGGFMSCSNNLCPCKNGTQLKQGGDYRVLFTGLCHGGQITTENGKRYMDCQLLDYWKILQDTKFLNSPYFDGMRNFNAVYEILDSAGFNAGPDKNTKAGVTNSTDLWPPAVFAKTLSDSTNDGNFTIASIGGEAFSVKSYGLPSSYDVLQSPKFKFTDGSGLDEAIIKIAQLSGYMVYFDRYGIFRFVPRSDNRACVQGTDSTVKCKFFASPTAATTGGGTFAGGDPLGTGCNNYDSLAFNAYTYQKKVSDVYNDIHLITATPNGELIIGSQVSLQSKFDYRYDGYMGYTKRFLQMDGIFGSADAIARTARYYSALFFPPITAQWESYGTATLNAGDLVIFTGLQIDNTFPNFREVYGNGYPTKSVLLYLTSVTMDIVPERNDWKNKYEGEWIFVDCNLITQN